jgi:hypothetical protein
MAGAIPRHLKQCNASEMLSPETVTLFEREAEAYFKKPKRESPFDCLERFIMRRLFDMYVQVHSYLVLSLSLCVCVCVSDAYVGNACRTFGASVEDRRKDLQLRRKIQTLNAMDDAALASHIEIPEIFLNDPAVFRAAHKGIYSTVHHVAFTGSLCG